MLNLLKTKIKNSSTMQKLAYVIMLVCIAINLYFTLQMSILFSIQHEEYVNYVQSMKDNISVYKSSPETYKENNKFLVLVPDVDGRKIVYVIDKQNKTQDNISSFYLNDLQDIKVSQPVNGTDAGKFILYVLLMSFLISIMYYYFYKNLIISSLSCPIYFMIPIVLSATITRMFGFNEIVCELIIIIVYLSYTTFILKPNSVCSNE